MQRPHANLIKKWADNNDCQIWYYDKNEEKWENTPFPSWEPTLQYVVVLKEYAEAWQAWIDGELQILMSGGWTEWGFPFPPQFTDKASDYRRKPKPVKPQPGEKWKHFSGLTVVVTGKTSGVVIDKVLTTHTLHELVNDWNWSDPDHENDWTKVS